jgi:prepilin-type N-terminal cleavage/methylation domain-containing protein
MKTPCLFQRRKGFTALELLVVLAVISALFAFFILPQLSGRNRHVGRSAIKCKSNLKQVALSFKMFAGDNNGEFPFAVPVSPAYTNDTQAWLHFLSMSNELGSTKILLCPSDDGSKLKIGANIFGPTSTNDNLLGLSTLKNSAVSYFVGLDAKETSPNAWLTGDGRFDGVGSLQTGPLLTVDERSKLRWLAPLHERSPYTQACPNVALADGSVSSGSNFVSAVKWPSGTTNRILLPQ